MVSKRTAATAAEIPAAAIDALSVARDAAGNEAEVETALVRMFEALGCSVTQQHPAHTGWADIHMGEYNLTVEAKAPGKIVPSQAEPQLHAYVKDIARQDLEVNGPSKHPRWGIITDGQSTMVYRYDNDGRNPVRHHESEPPVLGESTAQETIFRLQQGPLRRQAGKPWAGGDLYRKLRPIDMDIEALFQNLKRFGQRRRTYIRNVETKFKLWQWQMEETGVAPESTAAREEMFAKHTFLVAMAKCVIAELAEGGPPTEDNLWHGIGHGFTAWLVTARKGRNLVDRLWSAVSGFEWRLPKRDVLRVLYEHCVDKQDRKMYGEFYTPDELADRIALDLLDEEWLNAACEAGDRSATKGEVLSGIGVLDPTCGSGTFLFHAARRLVNHSYWKRKRASKDPQRIANAVSQVVIGIDIHPVAVEMAKTTLLRALPATPALPLRVGLGDALMTHTQRPSRGQRSMGEVERIELQSTEARAIVIPGEFARHPNANVAIATIVDAAYTNEPFPAKQLPPSLRTREVEELHSQLTEVCKHEGNSTWAWWIENMLHPTQIAERGVDRILANPPWVIMNHIDVPTRKVRTRELAVRERVWPGGGHNAASFDMAAVVSRRCMSTFGTPQARSAWVLNSACLDTQTWEKWRIATRPFRVKEIDLRSAHPAPFSGALSAVAIMDHSGRAKVCMRETWVRDEDGRFVDDPDNPPAPRPRQAPPQVASDYVRSKPGWKRGGCMGIQSLLLADADSVQHSGRRVSGMTTTSRHEPWKSVGSLPFDIPSRWLHDVVDSQQIHPFVINPRLRKYIIPVTARGKIASAREAEREAYWREAEGEYQQFRGPGVGTADTLLGNIEHVGRTQKALDAAGSMNHQVIYPTSGKHMKAGRTVGLVPGDNVYHIAVQDEAEAKYLCCILNATAMNTAFAAAREADRHFHLHPWQKMSIRRYDRKNPLHRKIATCCRPLEKLAESTLREGIGTIKQDKEIRKVLAESDAMAQLNELVRKLLPKYAT